MPDPWLVTTEPLRTDRRDAREVRRFTLTVDDGPDQGATFTSATDRVVVGSNNIDSCNRT